VIYRYDPSNDPVAKRITVLRVALALAVLGGALLARQAEASTAALVILIGGGILWLIITISLRQYRNTFVQTTDDELICKPPRGDRIRVPWDEITHAGKIVYENGSQLLYAYAEGMDQYLAIPNTYADRDELLEEFGNVVPLVNLDARSGESPADVIHRHLRSAPTGPQE